MSFTVVQSRPEHADQLAEIQRAAFPTLADEERITAAHYRAQMDVFPEGQLCVLNEQGLPVASSTDLICVMDFDHYQHRYIEAVGHNWLTTHKPDGDWLYGADIGVHPDWRGKGLSTLLYDARKNLIRRLGLKGHVIGGLPAGYGAAGADIDIEDYVAQVAAGTRFDPTLSIQMKRGFTVHGILRDYVDDPGCGGFGVLMVWNNPDLQP